MFTYPSLTGCIRNGEHNHATVERMPPELPRVVPQPIPTPPPQVLGSVTTPNPPAGVTTPFASPTGYEQVASAPPRVDALAWRPPHPPVTRTEEQCVDAFAALDARMLVNTCGVAQADWSNRRIATGAGSAAYYDVEFSAAYYTAYYADGLTMLHDARARQYAELAKNLFLDVGDHSTEYGYWARLALVYLDTVFSAAGV